MSETANKEKLEPTELEIELFNGTAYHQKRWSGDGGRVDEDATDAIMMRAHDELTRLRTLLEDLVRAVEPFADIAAELSDVMKDGEKNSMLWAVPKVGDLRRAREAYLKAKGE